MQVPENQFNGAILLTEEESAEIEKKTRAALEQSKNERPEDAALNFRMTSQQRPQPEVKQPEVKQPASEDIPGNKEPQVSKIQMELPPGEYVQIKLPSAGRLGYPGVIHVRDYRGSEAMDLGSMSLGDDDFARDLSIALRILGRVVYEDIDPLTIHEADVFTIFFNLRYHFWGPIVSNYIFPLLDSEFQALSAGQKEELKNDFRRLFTTLDLRRLNTIVIREDFKEPIRISFPEGEACYRLPRLGDTVRAENYLSEKFMHQDEMFAELRPRIKEYELDQLQGVSTRSYVTAKQRHDFYVYKENRLRAEEDYRNACCLLSYHPKDGQHLDFAQLSIADRIEKAKDIPSVFYIRFLELVKEIVFGFDPEIVIRNPITDQDETRRCEFRLLDIIPSRQLPESRKGNVSFG